MLNGRELAVGAYLVEHVVPLMAGGDPCDIEDAGGTSTAALTGGAGR